MQMTRKDGRGARTPREIEVQSGFQRFPEGSALYRSGNTRILIAASIEEFVPPWMKGRGKGWVGAEYEMHPRCNPERQRRSVTKGKVDGRSSEIQRLIGRSLRAAVRMDQLGERMLTVDCDVLDADGGTRTASITGGFIALAIALDKLRQAGAVGKGILREPIAAISVGMVEGSHLVDLCYEEDSRAEVDLNVVATASGSLIEVQGTAEGAPIPKADFDVLLEYALAAIPTLVEAQRAAIAKAGVDLGKLAD